MIIVDTNILIGIERGELTIKSFIEQNSDEDFYISAISIQELFVGLGYSKIKMGNKFYEQKKAILESIINDFHVFEISEEILKLAGQKQGELMAQGITLDNEDFIIGITAEIMKATKIFSKNSKHFENFSIPCVS
jgi:predicted nucleic acid-binding protein